MGFQEKNGSVTKGISADRSLLNAEYWLTLKLLGILSL
jgi:hypothetical protein